MKRSPARLASPPKKSRRMNPEEDDIVEASLSPIAERSRLSLTSDLSWIAEEKKFLDLEERLLESQAALKRANARSSELESENASLQQALMVNETKLSRKQSEFEDTQIHLEAEMKKLSSQLSHERTLSEEAIKHQAELKRKIKEEKVARKKEVETQTLEVAGLKEKIAGYEEALHQKDLEFDDELDDLNLEHLDLQSSMKKLQVAYSALKVENKGLRKQAQALLQRNVQQKGIESKLRLKLEEERDRVSRLSRKAESSDEEETQMERSPSSSLDALVADVAELGELRRECENLRIKVADLSSWKEEHLQIEEKYFAGKAEVSRFKTRLEELETYQFEFEQMKQQFDRLEENLGKKSECAEFSSVETFLAKVSDLRKQNESLQRDKDALQKEIRSIQRAEQKEEVQEEESQMVQGELFRVQAERDVLLKSRKETRELLNSICEEKALSPEEIEQLLKSFDAITASCEQLVQSHVDNLLKQNEALEKQISSMRQENLALNDEICVYESRVSRGEFNYETTKVIHLSINPTSTSNTKELHEKLRAAEQEETKAARSDEQISQHPKLKSVIQRLKTKHENELSVLKKSMRQKIAEYRTMVYRVFGWRLDPEVLESGQQKRLYKLQSMYAGDDEFLLFEYVSGSLELLQNEFGDRLMTGPAGEYLREHHSVPAFLSQVTLQLLPF